jgi:hypothetical protein
MTIKPQVIDGSSLGDCLIRLHGSLTEKGSRAAREDPQSKVSIAADNKEVVTTAIITADQTDAVGIRPAQLAGIYFDARITKVPIGCRPYIRPLRRDQDPVSAAV